MRAFMNGARVALHAHCYSTAETGERTQGAWTYFRYLALALASACSALTRATRALRRRACKPSLMRRRRRRPTALSWPCEVRQAPACALCAVLTRLTGGLSTSVESVRTSCVDLIAELEARFVRPLRCAWHAAG